LKKEISEKKLREQANIIFVISKFTDIEYLKKIFSEKGFMFVERKEDFYWFKVKYKDPKTEETATIHYYLKICMKNGLLVFFSTSPKKYIERTLLNIIERESGFYYLWMSPGVIEQIKNKIFSGYPETQVPYFSIIRQPYYRFSCRIRPEERRRIQYNGTDGRDMLEEFKVYYGMLPRLIEFLVPGQLRFKLDYRGIFTLMEGELGLLDEIIKIVSTKLFEYKKIIENSSNTVVKITSDIKSFLVPKTKQWTINFSRAISYEDIGSILKVLEDQSRFSTIDNFAEKGSLFWTATMIDSQKNSIFTIKSDGKRMYILPKFNNFFDSFLRFYHFFVENIDSEAIVEGENYGNG